MTDAYFLYHSIGMYPGKDADLARALSDFAGVWGKADDSQWGYVLPLRARFIDRWRTILNAGPQTVTTFDNVTAAFHSLLQSLPKGHLHGRTVLVGADCFPSNHFLLNGMAEAHGFTLKTVAFRQGAAHVEDEDFLDAWTADVGLALLTWVSSTTSHRIDLARMVAHGRRMGSLIGVAIGGWLSIAEPGNATQNTLYGAKLVGTLFLDLLRMVLVPLVFASIVVGVANLRADLGNGFGAVGAHRPIALEARQFHEVFVKLRAFWGVVHFGVELNGVETTIFVRHGGNGG